MSDVRRLLRSEGRPDTLAQSLEANADSRKPVRLRRGPATVTGSYDADRGSTPLGLPGRRAVRPKPGDLFVRATCRSLAGGMVALRTEAQTLAHLRSAGGGLFGHAPVGSSRSPRGPPRAGCRRGVPGRRACGAGGGGGRGRCRAGGAGAGRGPPPAPARPPPGGRPPRPPDKTGARRALTARCPPPPPGGAASTPAPPPAASS